MSALQQRIGSSQSVVAAAMLIAALSLASRVLGLLRDRILASTFGAGVTLDAYYAAFRIPDFLFNLLGLGALSAAFLPIYIRLRAVDPERSRTLSATVMSDIALALIVLCGIGFLAAEPIYRVLVPGFALDTLALTVTLGRIMFFASFLLGCSTVVGGILQAEQRFLAFASAPLVYNLGIIIGAVLLVPLMGPAGLAWGVVLGAFLHFHLQWIAARRTGFRVSWRPSWRDLEVRRTIKLLVPRVLGLASDHIQLIILTAIASTLAVGSLAVFTFASNIQMVPVSLFGIAFAVAAFPQLAAAAQTKDLAQFRERFSAVVRQIALLAFPATVLLITLKAQIVRVLLGAGAFDWSATVRTLETLEAFGIGLVAAMLVPVCARSFYAFEDTRTPFFVSLLANAVAVILALSLGRSQGARGLALAVAIAATVQVALLLIILRVRVGPLDEKRIARSIFVFGLAASVMAIVIQAVKPLAAGLTGTDTFFGIGLQGLLATVLGGLVYLGVGILLKSEEITALAQALRRRALRLVQLPFGGADEARG